MCAAHTHADTHAHHCIARPRVSVCLFAFEGCDKSTKGQDFDLIPCTRPDANNTSKAKILVNLSRSPGQYAYSPQPHTLRLPILSKPRVPALTWYSCRTKMRGMFRVCARCPHRCVLLRERHGACGVLPTGHCDALAGSGSPYHAPSPPQSHPLSALLSCPPAFSR